MKGKITVTLGNTSVTTEFDTKKKDFKKNVREATRQNLLMWSVGE